MKRQHVIGLAVGIPVLILLLIAVSVLYSCGSSAGGGDAATTTSTTSTTSTSLSSRAITGTVQVPAATLTGSRILRALKGALSPGAATSDDGISDTALGECTVTAYDPVTLTACGTATADSSGNFTMTVDEDAPDSVKLSATKASGDQTIVVNAFGQPGTSGVELDAGSTVVCDSIQEKIGDAAGDLLTKAETLPETSGFIEDLWELWQNQETLVGTLSSAPDLTYDTSGKTQAEIAKEMYDANISLYQQEYSDGDASSQSGADALLSALASAADELELSGSYPTGLELPSGYSDYTIDPNFSFPVGTKFPYSPEEDFIPSGLWDNFPSDAAFLSGFPLPPSDVDLPSGLDLSEGFVLPSYYATGLPDDVYLWSGCDLPDETLLPSGVTFQSGFLLEDTFLYASGYEMPSGLSYESGFTMPSGMEFDSGYEMPSGMEYESGFVMPSGIEFESGYEMPSGMEFESGFEMPSGMEFESGFEMPSGIGFESGFVPPSGMEYESGFEPPSDWEGQNWYSDFYSDWQ